MGNELLEKQIDYLNEILAETLESFWDERGRGVRYRTTLIGVDSFKRRCEFEESPDNISGVVEQVKNYLLKEGIISSFSFTERHDFAEYIEVEIEDCLHLEVEQRLKNKGISEPLACPCANLVMYQIEDCLGLTTELADVKLENNVCKLCIVVFRSKD